MDEHLFKKSEIARVSFSLLVQALTSIKLSEIISTKCEIFIKPTNN